MAKGTVPDEHPLLLGMPGFWGTETTNAYTRDADVVLAIGTRFAETDASSWNPDYTWRFPPSRLIQIDIDPAEIGRNYPVEIGAVADAQPGGAARSPRQLRRQRAGRRVPARAARGDRRRPVGAVRRQRANGGAATSSRCGPSASSPTCGRRCPADAVLVTDVGWNKNGVAQCYPLPAAGRFITPGGASTMGFGPAAALGVQMAAPDRVVVALIGDGGMSAQLPAVPMAVERGPAGDLPGDEQPGPRHDRRPAGGQLRRELRLRVPRPGRATRTAPTSRRSGGPAAPTATRCRRRASSPRR